MTLLLAPAILFLQLCDSLEDHILCSQCGTLVSGSRENIADICHKLLCFSVLTYLKAIQRLTQGIHLCSTQPKTTHRGEVVSIIWWSKSPQLPGADDMVATHNRPPKVREENLGRECLWEIWAFRSTNVYWGI